MPYSGSQVTQLRPAGHAQAKPAGSFAGKEEAEVVIVLDDGAAWFIVMKAARMIR